MFHGRRNREYWKACKEVQTYAETDIQEIPLGSPLFRNKVENFLAANGLRLEEVDSYYALLDNDDRIVAGAGILKDVLKCVAVDSTVRSGGLLAPLVSHIISTAASRGVTNLKVFTKPGNEGIFKSLGFHTVACAPKAIFMENGHGLEDYLRSLASEPSSLPPSVGVIIMNANPFTLGHQYLVKKASEAVDRLYVIPVKDDIPFGVNNPVAFPYEERLAMIKAGCDGHAIVLEGSDYQISDITFPTYFLKDFSEASETQIRLDLDLFGRHVAPALGISVRFVGSEPSDPLTARYNELMKEILPSYGISIVEIPRLIVDLAWSAAEFRPYSAAAKRGWTRPGSAGSQALKQISASEVREALSAGRFRDAASQTPATTWPCLVAELMARALRMELDAPFKPGLVDPFSKGAHSDMDHALMKGSIEVIRRSFVRHLPSGLTGMSNLEDGLAFPSREIVEGRDSECPSLDEALTSFGKEIEADVLAYTGGVNTYRGAIFALGLASVASLISAIGHLSSNLHHNPSECGGGQLADNQLNSKRLPAENEGVIMRNLLIDNPLGVTAFEEWLTPGEISETIARLASFVDPVEGTHGSRAVSEYAVKGALQMAREGYRPLFDDWLPFYRRLARIPAVSASGLRPYSAAETLRFGPGTADGELVETQSRPYGTMADVDPWRLQKTLLRIMSQLEDTCIIHRVGYERAREVKEEAKRLFDDFTPEGLKDMKARYDAEGISPGGAADMLALTILVDSLLK